MDRPWIYLINPILTATEHSNVLGARISNKHDGALFNNTGNPFIAGLYGTYHPFHVAYIGAIDSHLSKEALQIGATNAFNLLFDKLGFEKINSWDAAIQVVFPKGSTGYLTLLPNGHYPFQQGTQQQRKSAASSLSITIGANVALETVKEDIDAFVLLLTTADTAQQAAFNAVGLASNALNTARINMSNEQYANLGAMMRQYKANPLVAAEYFDLVAIRQGKQIFFQNHVKKNSKKFIVQRTLLADAQLELSNIGDTTLRFYLSDRKTGAIGTTFVEVLPTEIKTISASELGDVTTLHFLMVFNLDLINKGEFTVEFL